MADAVRRSPGAPIGGVVEGDADVDRGRRARLRIGIVGATKGRAARSSFVRLGPRSPRRRVSPMSSDAPHASRGGGDGDRPHHTALSQSKSSTRRGGDAVSRASTGVRASSGHHRLCPGLGRGFLDEAGLAVSDRVAKAGGPQGTGVATSGNASRGAASSSPSTLSGRGRFPPSPRSTGRPTRRRARSRWASPAPPRGARCSATRSPTL